MDEKYCVVHEEDGEVFARALDKESAETEEGYWREEGRRVVMLSHAAYKERFGTEP